MRTLWQDLRYSLRMLRKHHGFTVVAALVLALGIGANAAIFSIVNAFLFRPLPVKDPQQLAVLLATGHHVDFPHPISYLDYLDYRDEHDVFSELAAQFPSPVNWNSGGPSERAWVMVATGNYFSMLGVEPALGRLFTAEDDRTLGANPVVVIGYGCWQRRFGSDPGAVGKTIKLNGHSFTVIGVAPEKMTKIAWASWEAYIPSMMGAVIWPEWELVIRNRAAPAVMTIGRLLPNINFAQANAMIARRARQLEEAHPETNRDVKAMVVPESKARPEPALAGYLPPIACFVLAVVGLVLAAACANVASLMLARGAARQKELAIRAALGASRGYLIRLLLTESLLLALIGGVAGVLLSLWIADLFAMLKPGGDIPIMFDFRPDWRVLGCTLVVTIVAGLVTGIFPAFQASRPDLNTTLKEGMPNLTRWQGRHRLRSALVVTQVAVSMMLLVCAGLFIRSTQHARQFDLGFRTRDLLLLEVNKHSEPERNQQFYEQLVERAQSLPGVRSAGLASRVPFGAGQGGAKNIFADERAESTPLLVASFIVSRNYFRTMEIPMLRGRDFNAHDNQTAPRVVIINQTLADQLWPGQDSLGRRFRLSRDEMPVEVVGVVKTHKYTLLNESPRPSIYLPLAQNNQSSMTLLLQTSVDQTVVAGAARDVVHGLDVDAAVHSVRTMETNLNTGTAFGPMVIGVAVVGAFGILAMLLAAVGLYGLISFNVTRRIHEIGVRLAFGARPHEVLKLIVGQGMKLVLIGIGLGLISSLALNRLLASLLFGVSGFDPVPLAGGALLLAGVALLACYLPARRAIKFAPLLAIRYE